MLPNAMNTTPPDYSTYLDGLFGQGGHTAYLDSLLSGAPAGGVPGIEAPTTSAAPAPSFADSVTGSFTDYDGKVKTQDGAELDAKLLRHLAGQVAGGFDVGASSGGAYGAKDASISFDKDEAAKLWKGTPTGAQQIAMRYAAELAKAGVTDVSQLAQRTGVKRTEALQGDEMYGNAPASAEYTRQLVRKGEDGRYYDVLFGDSLRQAQQLQGTDLARDYAAGYDSLDAAWSDEDQAKYGTPVQPKDRLWQRMGTADLGATYHGDGATKLKVDLTGGAPRFYTQGYDNSDRAGATMMLSALAAPVAGLVAPALQAAAPALGTVGSNVATGAILGAGQSAITGGDVLKGALGGAIGGGITGLNPAGMVGVNNPIAGGALNGAIRGGITSALNGGDLAQGVVGGAAGGAVAGYNPSRQMGITDPYIARLVNSTIQGGVRGAISGNVQQGLFNGAVGGLIPRAPQQRKPT